MVNKNSDLGLQENNAIYHNLRELEKELESDLDRILGDLTSIDIERDNLQNNRYLEEAIQDIIWEQVQNQLAVQLGEEFIKENRGQTLDLRKSAHIQTSKNFEKAKFATHNQDVDYKERYNVWQSNFTFNKKGDRVLKKSARKFFDKNREKGSASIHKDHTISIKEQLNDIELATYFSKEEVKDFANSSQNLHDLDASANMSKGDKTMTEFLNSERNTQRPEERFNIDRKQLEKDEVEAREELKNRKKEAKEKAIKSGKLSRRKEAFKVTGKALKAAIFQLLSEFLKEIIKKFIIWFSEKEKNFNTFIGKAKEAISSFVSKLSQHIISVGESMIAVLATSIIGPVVGTFMRIWTFVQQGWSSLKDVIDYLRNPENNTKNINTIMLELGKIIIAGVTTTSAIVLSDTIAASIAGAVPTLAIEIPLLGSLASIIGTFMGATVAGVSGAFVLKLIDQTIILRQINELNNKKIDGNNDKLILQARLTDLGMLMSQSDKLSALSTIEERHQFAVSKMEESFTKLTSDCAEKSEDEFADIDALLDELSN